MIPKPTSSYIEILSGGISFNMVHVEGGVFDMGSEGQRALSREKPVHRVHLDSFFISQYPITQSLWKTVMGAENNPSFFQGDNRPVETVSWDEIQTFIEKLNEKSGKIYRLPTEAEWEYAARGGQRSQGYLYAGSNKLEEVGWFRENSDMETKAVVGQKQPNELGIYDMSGNVYEWCQDWYDDNYYETCSKQGIVKNPEGPDTGAYRVIRGGSWDLNSEVCRSAHRYGDSPVSRFNYLGFRLVLSPSLG